MASMKPQLQGPALVLTAILVFVEFLFLLRISTATRRWFVALGGVAVLCSTLLLVPFVTVLGNNSTYGVAALDPSSGSYLYARWAPLVPCQASKSVNPLAAAAIQEVCRRPFTTVPGSNADYMFEGGPLFRTLLPSQHPPFALTQSQLSQVTTTALQEHLGDAAFQVGRSLWFQIAALPVPDFGQYRAVGSSQWPLADDLGSTRSRVFDDLAAWTWPSAQILFWITGGLQLISLVLWPLRRRRSGVTPRDPSSPTRPIQGTLLRWLCLACVVSSMLMIAGFGSPMLRYLVTETPALLVLTALGIGDLLSLRTSPSVE